MTDISMCNMIGRAYSRACFPTFEAALDDFRARRARGETLAQIFAAVTAMEGQNASEAHARYGRS